MALFFRLTAACVLALAATHPAAHAQTTQTVAPTLAAALQAAWQRSPQARTLEARRDEVAAGRIAADAWTPGPPSLGLSEISDRWTGQTGQREAELSLSAPLWLPGQKAARGTLAQSSAQELEAQISQARLSIAGEVRERAWAVAAARASEDDAADHLEHLQALADDVQRRVAAGDLAKTDGMLAMQEVLAAKAEANAAAARSSEALTRFTILTGLPGAPAPEAETQRLDLPAEHPRIAAARAALQHAQRAAENVRANRSDPPVVGLALRRERDSLTGLSSRNVGISVQIPLGTPARNRPLESAAHTLVETATSELAQAEATVHAELTLASRQVNQLHLSATLTAARAELTRQHWQLIDKAFRLGERGLAETIRAQTLAHEATAADRQTRVALGLAQARLNQAKGLLP